MPTSNETRVRVDGRSKIIASVLPASGRQAGALALDPRRLHRRRPVEDAAKLPARKIEQIEEMPRSGCERARSWQSFSSIVDHQALFDHGASGVEPPYALGDLLVGDDERRQ